MPNNDFREQDLLSLQHQLFVHALDGKLTTTKLIPTTKRILDLGTGPGHWAVAMSRKYPRAEVVGIDMTEWDLNTTEATIGEAKVLWEIDDLDVWGREPDLETLTSRLEQFDFFVETDSRNFMDKPAESSALEKGLEQMQAQAGTSTESFSIDDPYALVGQPEPGWHFSEPFELIHLRNMTAAFAHWEMVYAEIYKSLSPGGWVEIADVDLGSVPLPPGGITDMSQLPMPTLRRLYTGVMEASFKSGRPLGTYYMNPSYLEEAGFTDIQMTQVNVPVGQWHKDEKQKSIGKLMQVVMLERLEACFHRLLTRWGDKEKVWTVEEIESAVEVARAEMGDWFERAERGECEGWCATFKWITARKSWHST